jgi:integrase
MKRKYPGIQSRTQADGTVAWRARVEVSGKQRVGSWRTSQAEASQDREALRLAVDRGPRAGEDMTLGQALASVLHDAKQRGVSELALRIDYAKTHARLLRYFRSDYPLGSITKEHVERFIRLRLATTDERGQPQRPASPNTINEKDLAQLGRAFRLHGVPNPVSQAKRPRKVRPEMSFFTLEECQDIIRRMRTGKLFHQRMHKDGTPLEKSKHLLDLPAREHDADLLEFILLSGIRVHEFHRVKLSDVNLQRGEVRIREPKISHKPRTVHLAADMLPIVRRLVEWAEANGHESLTGGAVENFGRIAKRWKRRLNEPRLNGRTLRHTSITLVLLGGGTLPEAMSHAGHSKVSTTDRYVHALKDKEAVSTSRIASMLRKPSAGPTRTGTL